MSTAVQLCNLALSRVGQDPVLESLETPATVEEQLCSQFYPMVRDYVLTSFDWTFSRVKDHLGLLANEKPHPPFKFIYQCPTDCARVISIFNEQDPRPQKYSLEAARFGGRFICTDIPDAWIEYQLYGENVTVLPPNVEDALVWLLAAELAGALLKSSTGVQLSGRFRELGEQLLQKAAGRDISQSREFKQDFHSEFELARL